MRLRSPPTVHYASADPWPPAALRRPVTLAASRCHSYHRPGLSPATNSTALRAGSKMNKIRTSACPLDPGRSSLRSCSHSRDAAPPSRGTQLYQNHSWPNGHVNGQCRSQATLDAGVRRTAIITWELPAPVTPRSSARQAGEPSRPSDQRQSVTWRQSWSASNAHKYGSFWRATCAFSNRRDRYRIGLMRPR
jgi:hypothetical protein